jgi:hypothetical protein
VFIHEDKHGTLSLACHACFVLTATLLLSLLVTAGSSPQNSIGTRWSLTELQGVRDSKLGAPVVSRALAVVNTCMYDAWAAYDDRAVGTQLSAALRRPPNERTLANKEKAISYAAFRALSDVFPADTESVYKPLMNELGYDPNNKSTDIETPEGIGNVACSAVLEFRHHDKSNQLGDMLRSDKQNASLIASASGPYGDWSGYATVNSPGTLPARTTFLKPLNPDHWQPLTYTDSTGNLILQMFSGAQWPQVTPFALAKGDELRSALDPAPAKFGSPEYQNQAEELVALSANLTDHQKMLAEYWSGASDADGVPVRWLRFAEFVSSRDHHTLDDDVKMYFALSNAVLDADIAAWDAKRAYDSVRPATAIPLLFRGKQIRTWGGPGKGTVEMDGGQWLPYEPSAFPTPPSPDYVSNESAESAAAARILALFTGSDHLGYSVTLEKGSSKIEDGITPHEPVTLKWKTFTEAANEAGMSGRYSGIDFAPADLAGRKLGRLVAERVWDKAQVCFEGTVSVPLQKGEPSPPR